VIGFSAGKVGRRKMGKVTGNKDTHEMVKAAAKISIFLTAYGILPHIKNT
jgi:hypothetical protein